MPPSDTSPPPLDPRSGGAPLWLQIRDQLATEIAEGRWGPGERLPSEHALAERFGVNRHTLRRAVGDLAEAGMVHVRRGAGAMVTEGRIDYRIGGRQRFSANIAAIGRAHGRRLLGLETVRASRAEALALELAEGELVHAVESLSEADGAPVIHSRMTFPARLAALPEALRTGSGVTAALAACGVQDYRRAWTRMTAGRPGALIARHLQMPEGGVALLAESMNRAEDGRPVEYALSWFCTDRMSVLTGDEAPPEGL
ncbi:phosphonate metabolism transcriptional regulator PhnF [Rhodovulum sp. DZ06]|uniref:phosphonate metabolism transcriptional regulator PhnF n=1 Tax=Rhodovulum sp. DZ06 TaxID=3425126 RepID=UPI003D354114